MCGRFVLYSSAEEIGRRYQCKLPKKVKPNYNIAPQSDVVTIFQVDNDNNAIEMRWGFLPSWAAENEKYLINARAETANNKPMFKKSFQNSRCIIPANGFYEWSSDKQPYYIYDKNQPIISLAGIYSYNSHLNQATVAIITIPSRNALQNVHDRQPMVLGNEDVNEWLNNVKNVTDMLNEYLHGAFNTPLSLHPVSKLVNSPKNNDKECIEAN